MGEAFGVSGHWICYGDGKTEASHPRDAVKLSSKRLPVLGQAIPGEHTRFVMNRQTIDEVMCPPGLENVPEAYAVFVLGDSMEPRYQAGEVVYVHPNKPCRKGDYVIAQTQDAGTEHPIGFISRF